MSSVVAQPCHPKQLLFLAFFEEKNVSNTKTNHFRFANVLLLKTFSFQINLNSFRKHFHFCSQIKIFSFQKQWTVRMGSGGCNAVSQHWSMLACSLV